MHIVEVTYSWPAETFIVRHALALHEASYSLDLVIASKSPWQPLSASVNNNERVPIPIVSLPNFDYFGRLRKLREAASTLSYRAPQGSWHMRDKAILRAFSALKPDLVHFHFGSLAVMLAQYPRALSLPYTVSLRGSDIQVMPLDNGLYTAQLRETLDSARGIHVVSDDIARQSYKVCGFKGPVTTIRTCVPLPERALSQAPLSEPLRFVSVGRLHWRKAFPDLVRAMALIPDAHLDIVGDGPEREHLLYLIHQLGLQSRVRLLGKLPYARFEEILARATAFVQASIAEGFSNALAEAMALGKAVFATDVGGTCEIIEDGQNGILLPPGDPAGIAEKLKLAKNSQLLQRLGAAARCTAEQEFSMQRHAQQFYDFYRQALNG